MKKEIVILTSAALIFVAPVAATNGNHNQGGNNSRHDQREARLAADFARVNFGSPHPSHTPWPSHTPHPSHTLQPTPPASAPENHPSHGGFDCGKIFDRVFKNFDFFQHHNK